MVRRLGRVALLMTLAAVLPAAANDYPNKQIRAIVSQGPGGLSDVFMRALADQLGPEIGGTVVVENRVGAAARSERAPAPIPNRTATRSAFSTTSRWSSIHSSSRARTSTRRRA